MAYATGSCSINDVAKLYRDVVYEFCTTCDSIDDVVAVSQRILVELLSRGELGKIPDFVVRLWDFSLRQIDKCGISAQEAATNAFLLLFALIRLLYGALDALTQLGVDPQLVVRALETSLNAQLMDGGGLGTRLG